MFWCQALLEVCFYLCVCIYSSFDIQTLEDSRSCNQQVLTSIYYFVLHIIAINNTHTHIFLSITENTATVSKAEMLTKYSFLQQSILEHGLKTYTHYKCWQSIYFWNRVHHNCSRRFTHIINADKVFQEHTKYSFLKHFNSVSWFTRIININKTFNEHKQVVKS